MTLVERVRSWDPVPEDRPSRVWVPAPRAAERSCPPRPERPSCDVVLALSPAELQHLGPSVPRLMTEHDIRPGDRVTVDLGDATCAGPAGLGLLLTVLWRRVGPQGRVALSGGSRALRAQLVSLGITPEASRESVYGTR